MLAMGPQMPRANKPEPHHQSEPGQQAERLDQRLDAALLETFPASDPIAVGRPTSTEPLRRAGDRRVEGAKVRRRATAMPAATSARPSKKVLRARS